MCRVSCRERHQRSDGDTPRLRVYVAVNTPYSAGSSTILHMLRPCPFVALAMYRYLYIRVLSPARDNNGTKTPRAEMITAAPARSRNDACLHGPVTDSCLTLPASGVFVTCTTASTYITSAPKQRGCCVLCYFLWAPPRFSVHLPARTTTYPHLLIYAMRT
jgi:hypothetical protein